MTVTTSFEVFRQRMIDNGSLQKSIQKRTHDKIITYDPNTNKLSYRMILCLGLLPDELVEPIHKRLYTRLMKEDVLDVGWSRFTLGNHAMNVLLDKCTRRYLNDALVTKRIKDKYIDEPEEFMTELCHCRHKNGNRCCRKVKEKHHDIRLRLKSIPKGYDTPDYYNELSSGFYQPFTMMGMCDKHINEWNNSPSDHKKQMIKDQLQCLGYRLHNGYILRQPIDN